MTAETKPTDNLGKYEANGMENGRFLWLVWAGWVTVLLLVVALFAASLPHAVFDVKYYEWQVIQARPAAATIFPTYDAFVAYILLLRMAAVAVFWGTAVYIAWRKPKDWLVLYVSATLLMMSYLFAFQSDVDRWRFPAGLLAFFPAVEWIAPLLFTTCFLLLFYLFPDGRFTPRWVGLVGLVSLGTSLIFFGELGVAIGLSEELAWFLFMLSILIFAFIGLASQMLKWRKATLVQKQQTRLVLLALITFISLPFLQIIFGYFLSDNTWLHFLSLHLFLIGATLIPLAIGMSALRYRLWQMDVLLSRTLVYGGLTAVVILLYIVVVGALSSLFGSGGNVLLAVLATGLIAVIFEPLKRRLQRSVNRLMYGQRDDPYAVMAALGKQLEQTAIPGETLPALVQTIAHTLKLPYVAIVDEANECLASVGVAQTMPPQTYPLVYQSQTIGQLVVAQRSEKEPFTDDEARLLRNVARQAGTAVYTAHLTADLQHARERLILAREEERRRLRRDLHDGLGPQLATLTMKISAAQNLLKSDPDNAAQLLAEVKAESQTAIKEIRQVVEGLRPSALDQFGLLSALQEFVAQNGNGRSHITLHAPASLPPLPAAVEVAAYRIAIEAMTNSLRHAQATTCTVTLRVNEQLTLEIRDDGTGLPASYRPGVGLSSMRERAEELNGSFEIISDKKGTVITAVLPLNNVVRRTYFYALRTTHYEKPMTEPIHILIADDHTLFRDGLKALFGSLPDTNIVGEAATGAEAIALAESQQPDVVLMDIQMPGLNGIEATRKIVQTSPHIGVIIVTMFEDDDSVFAAMRAGARGYVLKGADQEEMVRVIRAVAQGEALFGPAIAARLHSYFAAPQPAALLPVFPDLTEREREVLALLAQGLNNGDIAHQLHISPKTVRNHCSNIFSKLQVADRTQAIIRARDAGLG